MGKKMEEVEQLMDDLRNPKTLMVRVDNESNNMELGRSTVDASRDIYLRTRLDNMHRREFLNNHKLLKYTGSDDVRSYNTAVTNLKDMHTECTLYMMNSELININTQFYYSTWEVALRIIEKELGHPVYLDFSEMLNTDQYKQSSPLGKLEYSADDAAYILELFYIRSEDINSKYIEDHQRFAIEKLNMFLNKITVLLYNHISNKLYTLGVLRARPELIQEAASIASFEFHDSYMNAILSLFASFILSYDVKSLMEEEKISQFNGPYLPYGGF